MPLAEIGTGLLILTGIVIFGNLWFHFVETILRWIKKLFMGHKNPPMWHRFPVYKDEND